ATPALLGRDAGRLYLVIALECLQLTVVHGSDPQSGRCCSGQQMQHELTKLPVAYSPNRSRFRFRIALSASTIAFVSILFAGRFLIASKRNRSDFSTTAIDFSSRALSGSSTA